jgi:hypothetical protein
MKPRHSAALALVGWALICPPFSGNSISDNAPLSAWKMTAFYPTEDVCNLQRTGAENSMTASAGGDSTLEMAAAIMHKCQCIATDDPRLKDR